MKKQMIQILAIASLLSVSVAAQTLPPSPGDFSVFIPFEFRVGERVLPSGDYTIYQAASGLRFCGEGFGCMGTTGMALGNGPISDQARLAFRRQGNQNLLFQVWLAHTRYELSLLQREPDRATAVTATEIVLIEGRPLCIHQAKGRALSWH